MRKVRLAEALARLGWDQIYLAKRLEAIPRRSVGNLPLHHAMRMAKLAGTTVERYGPISMSKLFGLGSGGRG